MIRFFRKGSYFTKQQMYLMQIICSDQKEHVNMNTHRNIPLNKIVETVMGVILFVIAAGMRLVPASMRDDSGEAYIMIACLLTIGVCLFLHVMTDGKRQ
jgi:hypothetical protein